jgi:hypothetical protein
MSIRQKTVLEIRRQLPGGGGGALTTRGGTVILETPKHALDGPEHTPPTQGGDLEGQGATLEVRALQGVALSGTPAAGDDLTATAAAAAHWAPGFDATAPTASAPGDTGATGSAATKAHRDHKHARESYGAAGDIVASTSDGAAAAGASGKVADAGHKHPLASYASTPATVGTGAAGTSATAPSRGDHVHATGAGTPSTQAFGDAAATGTGPAAAMTDHKHGMPTPTAATAGPDADITVDAAGAAGTASTYARSGHGHKLATSASNPAATGTAAPGTSGHAPSRDDHVHAHGSAHLATLHTVSATDKLLGRATAGAGAVEEIACTAAGRALLDDADAAAQRATLGVSTGSVATDAIWDAAGDLAVGTGADTAAKLAKGADGQVLTVDPATHLLVWANSGFVSTSSVAIGSGSKTFDVAYPERYVYAIDNLLAAVADATHWMRGLVTAMTPGAAGSVTMNCSLSAGSGTFAFWTLTEVPHIREHDHSAAGDGSALAPASVAATGAVTGLIRHMVAIPFVFSGTLTPGTPQFAPLISPTARYYQRLGWGASVVGISVAVASARTAGTLVAHAYNNSTASEYATPAATIDAGETAVKAATEVLGVSLITATQQLAVRLTTTSFTPVANVVTGLVYVIFDGIAS